MGKDIIILLHGWGGSKKSLEQLGKELQDKFKVLNLELPGFGQTKEPQNTWGVQDYAQYVVKEAKIRKITNPYLFGHSFGGQIATQIVLDYPEKVKKLILCAPALIRKKTLAANLKIKTAKFLKNTPLSPVLGFLMRNSDYQKVSPKMKQVMNKILQEDLTNQLFQIKIPTLILWGEKDAITPLSQGLKIQKLIKNSRLITFEKEKHGLPLVSPQKVAKQIKEWIWENGH